MTLVNCRSLAQYLAACNSQKFTGTLGVRSADGAVWNIRFFIGRIVGEAGGVAPMARWKRHLHRVSPQFDWQAIDDSAVNMAELEQHWNTKLLDGLLEQQLLDRRQVKSVSRSSVIEVLFDIALEEERTSTHRTPPLTFTPTPSSRLRGDKSLLLPLDVDDVWEAVTAQLERWMEANGKHDSPNLVPEIVNPDLLGKLVSQDIGQLFSQLMDGKHSLRDVAAVLEKEVDMVYLSLCPFILAEAIALEERLEVVTEINPDFPEKPTTELHSVAETSLVPEVATSTEVETPTKTDVSGQEALSNSEAYALAERRPTTEGAAGKLNERTTDLPSKNASHTNQPTNNPAARSETLNRERFGSNAAPVPVPLASTHGQLSQPRPPAIAYVDDNQADYRSMKRVLSDLGFSWVFNISDPTLVLAALLENPPDLVFLGLENACDFCSNIRRVSPLKHVPIVIVTSSDGVIERMRAKLAGAYGFMTKPILQEDVTRVLQRFQESAPELITRSSPLSSIRN